MMKTKLLACFLVLLLGVVAYAAPPPRSRQPEKAVSIFDTDSWIDINKILMFATNTGSIAYDQSGTLVKSDGLYYPYTGMSDLLSLKNTTSVVFASGIWVGAVDASSPNNDTLVTVAEYSDEFGPGPLGDSALLAKNRVYALYKDSIGWNGGSTNLDAQEYMQFAVAQGAPTTVDDSGNTVPDILGDEFLWCVYNDADASLHKNNSGNTAGLGVEIRQSVFAFNRQDALGNIVFMRYRIYNKGSKNLTNMFVSLWSDPDLGGASDDLVGSVVDLSVGYCYNATNRDNDYGSKPPCVGYDFFQGPLLTGTAADTAKMWGTIWPGMKNAPMASFNKYINGTDPQNFQQTYQYMNGLDAANNGQPLIDPTTGQPTAFYGNGDPFKGTGFLDFAPDDRRFMLSTGPINFAPGDSTEVIAAIVVGQAVDRLTSIELMKFFDKFAQSAYDLDFQLPDPPAAPVVTAHTTDGTISLEWTNIPESNSGTYPFEGYSVSQGETPNGPWKLATNFDVVNGVGFVFDEDFDIAEGVVLEKPVKKGSDNGLKYFWGTGTDAIIGGSLHNMTDYYFKVDAYSFDGSQTPKTLTSSTVLTLTPQQPNSGTDISSVFGDTLAVTHSAGTSGGSVNVIVVAPEAMTGHDYNVIFTDTTIIDSIVGVDTTSHPAVYWDVVDVTNNNTVVLAKQFNQTNDEVYPIADGLQVKVSGPPPGFDNFMVVANGAGPISPPVSGAFDFQGFPTPGGTNPPDNQQVGAGHWGFHTGDNGGTNGGGTRGGYSAFIARLLRGDQGRFDRLGAYDWEMRFTGDNANPGVNGSWGWAAFTSGNAFWVPFELWRIGISTPNDPSDDLRVIPWIFDDGGDSLYYMSAWGSAVNGNCGPGGCEHSASGGDNDPYTDWVYWRLPADQTPGSAGYMTFETAMQTDPQNWAGNELAIFGRTVLVNWNGDTTAGATGGATVPSGYDQDLPEQGTIFRLTTAKPNAPTDVFSFSTPAPVVATSGDADQMMSRIKAVPNPYYLASSYDAGVNNRVIKFSNLPSDATIQIFTLGGDLVSTVNRDNMGRSYEEWNVESANGIPVASGIYIYVVESPMFGQKIGKMAVFTEEEQLGTF